MEVVKDDSLRMEGVEVRTKPFSTWCIMISVDTDINLYRLQIRQIVSVQGEVRMFWTMLSYLESLDMTY